MRAPQNAQQSGEPDGKDAVAYAELLGLAHEQGLRSIQTQILAHPTEENGHRCIVKAVVDVERGHFEGIGDADPGNVEDRFAPHLIRVAETRAKARALRDAVNCGIASLEELDGVRPDPWGKAPGSGAPPASPRRYNGQVRSSAPAPAPRGNGRSIGEDTGQDGPMSEAQRRYLFRLLAGQGYKGKAAEEYLYAELDVRSLADATRRQASDLIETLLHSAPARGGGNGAAAPQR